MECTGFDGGGNDGNGDDNDSPTSIEMGVNTDADGKERRLQCALPALIHRHYKTDPLRSFKFHQWLTPKPSSTMHVYVFRSRNASTLV